MNSTLTVTAAAAEASRPETATETASITCQHCGTPFRSATPTDKFCCKGCDFVSQLILSEGLKQFYDLKGATTTRPVQNSAFEQRDYDWLEEQSALAEQQSTSQSASIKLGLDGASCAACVWLIDHVFSKVAGGLRLVADPFSGQIEFSWVKGAFDIVAFARHLQQFGYTLKPWDKHQADQLFKDGLLNRLGLCAAFAMNGMAFTLPRYLGMPADFMFAGLFQLITALSASLALLVGGSYFIQRAWQSAKAGLIHIDLPIALGMLFAYIGSLAGWLLDDESMLYFDFVAIFVFLMLGGRWLQEQAMRRNRRHFCDNEAVPSAVGSEDQQIPLDALEADQRYTIKPNEVIPVASSIISGNAVLGLEWIQGESEIQELPQGGVAASGAINRGSHALELRARETWVQSLLYRLTQRQNNASSYPRLQQILRYYLGAVLILGLLGGLGWTLASGEIQRGLQVTLSIFVISCPCALGLAVPLADELAASAARRMGVFVQQLSFWSRLRQVRHILFDKTGTLTLETPVLKNPQALQSLTPSATQILARMAITSTHPISRSLSEHLGPEIARETPTGDFEVEEIPGSGLRYRDHDGTIWTLSKPNHTLNCDAEFRRGEALLAKLRFADSLRQDATAAIDELQRSGTTVHILSGDRDFKVAQIASALHIKRDQWHAGMTPDEKANLVREIDGKDTLFVGDGANDSLAFDRAYVTATPAFDRSLLTEKADCYFVTRGLGFLTPLRQLARRRQQLIRSVFAFTILYNAAAITVCLSGLMNPLLAAILMPLSSIVTTSTVALGFKQRAALFS